MKTWLEYVLIFVLFFQGVAAANEPDSKKIILIENAEILKESQVQQTAESESEKNKDGGYDANVNIVQCFAAMEYRYTGGRYIDEPIRFRLRSPKKIEPGKKYPLILWLHGFGESSGDNKRQLAHIHYAIKSFAGKDQLDFFMVATQCPPDNTSWANSISKEGKGDAPITIANEILEHVIAEYPIDTNRLGVIGVCSGGDAAWNYVADHPGRFASMIAFSCSPGQGSSPSEFEKTAVWAFNNKGDTVPFQPTVEMVKRINALGGNAQIQLKEGGLHITWDRPLARQELIRWMIRQNLDGSGPIQWNVYFKRPPLRVFLMFGLPVLLTMTSLAVLRVTKRKTPTEPTA